MKKTIALPAYKQFCTLLVEARQKAGILQADLAKKLRKPQSFISRVEAGQRRLDIFEYLTYLRAIGLDPYDVLQTIDRTKPVKESKTSRNRKDIAQE